MSIFEEQISRKPDHYPWAEKFISAMHEGFWTDKEFTFQGDIQDFKVSLTDSEKEIIIKSLSTIGQIEVSVKKYWAKLGDNLPHPSITDLGYVMSNVEVIHSSAYERLLEELGIEEAFDKILELDIIKGRVNYLRKHLRKFHNDNKRQFIYSLILFTLFVENVSLFSQFYIVSWFGRYRNVLKDTNKQIEYTAAEEDLHAKIGVQLINVIREEHPELFDEDLNKKILYEVGQAVNYECEIVDWMLGDFNHEKLNPNLLKEFIKQRMNDSLASIGYQPIFETDVELIDKTDWFDEQVLGNRVTDFFHSRPTEYSKSSQSFDVEDLF